MFHLLFATALLAAEVAAVEPVESPGVLLDVDFEAADRPLGCFALGRSTPETPVEGAADCPPAEGFGEAHVLRDGGDVPFRTWVSLEFDSALLKVLDGKFGVGFTPRLRLRKGLIPASAAVGAAGTVSFDGAVRVEVRGTRIGEVEAVGWDRGFEAGPSGPSASHRAAWSGTVPLRTTGARGPYRWTVEGTLSIDLHVYAGPAEPSADP